ncbi:MAG: hypothetical protein KGO81_07065 [Bacteroidota bacterium]|nr:hypothetical protein [Bacteroidota bacterium]
MRKSFFVFLTSLLCLLLAFNSCKKTGANINPLSSVSNLGIGSYLTLDSTLNQNLNYASLSTSTVGIMATQYPNGEAISSVIVYAVQGTSYDTTKWKKVKTINYTGPKTAITVSGSELATALGGAGAISPGSNYTFYNRIVTKSGKTYDVNNTGNNSGSGLVTGAYYHSAFSFSAYVVCPFVGPVAGTYKVLRDDWADWNPGDLVQVTDGPGPNEVNLSQVWPNPAYGTMVNPLVVDVDPASGTATVKKVNFGNYGGGYNMTAVGTGANGLAGYVFSCTGYITLTMSVVANATGGNGYNNGPTKLILQKQ